MLGPLIVTNPEYAIHEKNQTCTFAENTTSTATDSKLGNQDDATEVKFELTSPISEILETKYVVNIDSLKSGTKGLVFVYLGMSSLLFILAVVYFPPKPPRPPSYTASIERPHYRKAACTADEKQKPVVGGYSRWITIRYFFSFNLKYS